MADVAGDDCAGRCPTVDRALVSVRGLAAGYGELAAVRDLDLEVRPGEVVALLGPNGAGKTTTLLTIAGELPPIAGEVSCLGAVAQAPLQRRVRRGLAFVPEERAVFTSLTVAGNLRLRRGATEDAVELFPELGSAAAATSRAALGRRAADADPRPRRSRAAPKLLLVDELSLGLAPLVVARLLRAVRAAADRGVGVLLVEQHATEALSVADRVVVLQPRPCGAGGLRRPISGVTSAISSARTCRASTTTADAPRPSADRHAGDADGRT